MSIPIHRFAKRLFGLPIAVTLSIHVAGASAQEPADWWRVQKELTRVLFEENTEITKLAADLASSTPASGQEAMFKLGVMMRCEIQDEAIEALRELKALVPDLENHQVKSIHHEACEHLQQWEVARATVEIFAENISDLPFEPFLLKHFLSMEWTDEKVDKWLAGMPRGKENFWLKQRLRFNARKGRADALVEELAAAVRANPEDIEKAIAFLEALAWTGQTGGRPWDLSWMTETIKPTLATHAEQIATHLKNLGNCGLAAGFYEQAIDTPLTDEEVRELGEGNQVHLPGDTLKAGFAIRAREALGECLLQLGKNDAAQKRMVEAADLREANQMGRNSFFAGRVQNASGERTIEGRITENEEKSEDDPRYWRERALYYQGRKEPAQEEEALLKGLALAVPKVETEPLGKRKKDWPRTWLLTDYVNFLNREKRAVEAVALLRNEIESAPAEARSTEAAARILGFDLHQHIRGDDPVLWTWLENRPKWVYTEERLLWRMLENTRPANLEAHIVRAESATQKANLSRASILGWILNRMGHTERSIPLLLRAYRESNDDDLKLSAGFTLFESYLDTADWKNAEALFPVAAKRLTPAEITDWYSRIAILAANSGARADAMRIWGRVANLCPCALDSLDRLAKAGLKSELQDFYREMSMSLPSSTVPLTALAALEVL